MRVGALLSAPITEGNVKYSLAQQHQALMHCVAMWASAQNVVTDGDSIREAAEEGVNSFRFLRDNRDAYVALLNVLRTFPDAEVDGVRDMFFNGSGVDD
jgi:hypothetical protein